MCEREPRRFQDAFFRRAVLWARATETQAERNLRHQRLKEERNKLAVNVMREINCLFSIPGIIIRIILTLVLLTVITIAIWTPLAARLYVDWCDIQSTTCWSDDFIPYSGIRIDAELYNTWRDVFCYIQHSAAKRIKH